MFKLDSIQEAIEKLIKDGMQCPSKTKPIKYYCDTVRKIEVSPPVWCRILYFLVIDNERGEHQYNSEEEFHEAAGA